MKRPKSFIVLRQKPDPSDLSFVKNLWHHILISCPPPRFHSVSEMGKGIAAAVVVVDESDGTAPENPYD